MVITSWLRTMNPGTVRLVRRNVCNKGLYNYTVQRLADTADMTAYLKPKHIMPSALFICFTVLHIIILPMQAHGWILTLLLLVIFAWAHSRIPHGMN